MPDVLTLADQFHDQLERQDAQALARVIRAYAGIQQRLQGEIDALALEIEQGALTVGQVQKLARYRRLLEETGAEVQKFTAFMDVELGAMGREYVARGLDESTVLMRAAVDNQAALVARFRGLPPEAVERLLGFLDPQGPLYKRLKLLPGFVANAVSETILQSVALGRNPRTLARELTKAYGMGLSDSLRMARTVQLYSYREAARANYSANSEIVRGWQWYASLDSSVCLSCVAQHGKVYPLDQPLNDHHNGRCTQLPVTILSPNGHIQGNAGEQWFKGLSETEQQKMMGAGKFAAWKEGKFDLPALSTERPDEVYGLMRSVPSLKELIGAAQQ
jgi:SPP1 gp7 family putative phage head morphogenesis protein